MRRKTEVCNECRATLDIGRQLKEERRQSTHAAMIMREVPHALPYLRKAPSSNCGKVQAAFWRLSMLLSRPTDETADMNHGPSERLGSSPGYLYLWRDRHDGHSWAVTRVIDRATADALGDAYEAVKRMAEAAYADGHADGRNLLMQLASGDLTPDQFNERAARL